MNSPSKPKSAVVRLIIERMSQTLTEGGVGPALVKLLLPGGLSEHNKQAKKWVEAAIRVVRAAPDADPRWTDEQIAQRILDAIAAKRQSNSNKERDDDLRSN